MSTPSILAICGSTRAESTNLQLLRAIRSSFSQLASFDVFTQIGSLPHFNPDLDNNNPPQEIIVFRERLKAADAILICTPEYAMGVPGTLKNAIDWTVSSMEFSHKPTALITASSSGKKGHAALLETLLVIEADIPPSLQLIISFIKTKVRNDLIVDAETQTRVHELITTLIEKVSQATQMP